MDDTTAILKKIRDQYSDIQLLTMHCCSDIAPEAIPDLINQRAELMECIAAEKRQLQEKTAVHYNDAAATRLRKEIDSIIGTIVMLDKQVETVIHNHMRRLKTDLSMLYKTSRAASAYTIHSR
jgi:hypothetical protein